MKELAKQYLRYGLSILPVKAYGMDSKRPAVPTWSSDAEPYTNEECDNLFNSKTGIGIIAGKHSGNLEVLDFDNHVGNAKDIFKTFLKQPQIDDIVKRYNLPYERTMSGGYHLFYRCSKIEGNKKLASVLMGNGKPTTIIETRGHGGYVVAAPTIVYGVGDSAKEYKLLHGDFAGETLVDTETGEITHSGIATITEQERNALLDCARSFNEVAKAEDKRYLTEAVYSSDTLAGTKFNESPTAKMEVTRVLEKNGWIPDRTGVYFTRPGKEVNMGHAATLGKVIADIPLFYVYSSNAYPFEQMKSYSPFAVLAKLEFNDNFSEAARYLVGLGYGEDFSKKKSNPLPKHVQEEIDGSDDNKGKKRPIIYDIENFMDITYDFRFDEVALLYEYKYKNSLKWEPCNEKNIYCDLQRNGIKAPIDTVKALIGSDFVQKFNPFVDYFANNIEWCGIDQFKIITSYLKVDNPDFFAKMLEKQFVRAIKCALEPEYYNRMAFILQARAQEIGKSRFINFLNPFGLKYFSAEPLVGNKDCDIALTENFIYNLEEIDDCKNLGLGRLKAVLAKRAANVRLPYAAQKVNIPRRCSFFGSTNLTEFLTDDSNTRWLIFKVDGINDDIFRKVNIHQAWAQAWLLYNKKESYPYELDAKERMMREINNMAYKKSSIEQELILSTFVPDTQNQMGIVQIAKTLADRAGRDLKINLTASYLLEIFESLDFPVIERKMGGCVSKSIGCSIVNDTIKISNSECLRSQYQRN